jgi:DNA-binding transcriptional ArsR family regulator
MVTYSTESLDHVFGALADPTRRIILATLTSGEASVSELARPHRMSMQAILKHLHSLERAGLVEQHKRGRVRHCQLVAAPLREASDWLAGYRLFWEGQLDSLERYLSEQSDSEQALRRRGDVP